MIKVGIVGGTGYTGVELLRLLTQHPEVSLDVITSRSEQGIQVADMFPNLRGHLDLAFSIPEVDRLAECDVVFMATPHGVAMNMAPELLDRGVKVIDLGADFRIKDAQLWEQWYHMQHTAKDWITKAVYGLPEVNRDAIREAQLVACPGCYPTSVQLGFLPLLENALVDVKRLVADCKSGVTGAGRGAAVSTLLGEASENVKAYAVDGHRHLPEISQGLSDIAQSPVQLTFVPHLMPMIRGIHATLYSTLTADVQDVQNLYEQRYAHEPFVDVLPPGHFPETRSVKGSNTCRISVNRPQGGDTLVVLVVEDNLVKGAAGQAVQCMNLLFNIKETTGLDQIALLP